MRGDEAALAGRVRTEIQELMWVVERIEQLLAKANERQDDDYLDGVALNLAQNERTCHERQTGQFAV